MPRKDVTHHFLIRLREVATPGEGVGGAAPVTPASSLAEGEGETLLH